MTALRALAFASLLGACGGGSSGSSGGDGSDGGGDGTTAATGRFAGLELTLDHALAAVFSTSKGTFLDIALTERTTCGDATTNGEPVANDHVVELSLFAVPDLTTKTAVAADAPGTYLLDLSSGGPFAAINVESVDASCNRVEGTSGEYLTGTVTLTSADGTAVTGTIDVADPGGNSLTGSFTTTDCAAVDTLGGSGSATCVQ